MRIFNSVSYGLAQYACTTLQPKYGLCLQNLQKTVQDIDIIYQEKYIYPWPDNARRPISRRRIQTVVAIMVKTFDTKSHLTLPVVHSNISQAGRDMVTSLTSSIERTCKLLETFTGLKNPLGLTTDFIDGRHVFSNKSWVTGGGIFEPIVQSLYQTLHHADISVTISS